MEIVLDNVADGNETLLEAMNNFYKPFNEAYEEAKVKMYKDDYKETGEMCPICGKPIKVHKAKPVSDVDLVEATQDRQNLIHEIVHSNLLKEVANKNVSELHTMKELQAYGKLHGYKPGWAWFQAKRKGIFKSRK